MNVVWRSPFGASEDRNFTAALVWLRKLSWRPPSWAAEDPDYGHIQPGRWASMVTVAVGSAEGLQLNHDGV